MRNLLPMSTAPKDGRRIQVAVALPNGKVRWEHVERSAAPGSTGYWWGKWMDEADPDELDESNWLGWFPCPGEG